MDSEKLKALEAWCTHNEVHGGFVGWNDFWVGWSGKAMFDKNNSPDYDTNKIESLPRVPIIKTTAAMKWSGESNA